MNMMAAESVREPAAVMSTKSYLVSTMIMDSSEGTFSESPLTPMKTLLAASEIGGTSDRDLATPLFTTSEIADARFPDVVLNPVKALDLASARVDASDSERAKADSRSIASDTVGLSASPLNPVKSLLVVPEIG